MRMIFKLFLCFFLVQSYAQNTSSNLLVRSTVGVSGSSRNVKIQNRNYIVQQSIGQSSVIGTFAIGDLSVRQGFIQPNVFAKIKDEKILMNLDVVIYPNPFLKSISLLFNEEVKDKVAVEIYDMLGRLIFSNSYPPSQDVNVILDDFAVANYILKIQANNKRIVKKILKKQ
ncbi:T9SS type A sorting domain-containing protein [Flavobacterium yafengii]|uniref:T9SS type A sorting domain-containing protein n=1 Tax=Flavobacterium yafengii TaxID=3041253 RepID=UPI0024A99DDB|nr:T9SS type A sorting domain-containing protein [Flavobacterium yafengii]MDI5899391.1 T9SS type A sorting domain-containing protein [Flavobacterium yafengii]